MATTIQYGELDLFPPTQVIRLPLPDGDPGVELTIGLMTMAAKHGERDPQIRQLALEIVGGVANRDSIGELEAIYGWVKQNIAFRGEKDETVQTPEVTVKFKAGDCDDHSVLVCALAGAIGFDWEFRTVATHGRDYTHVYARILDNSSGEWVSYDPIAMDTTVSEAFPGWEPSGVLRGRSWGMNGLESIVWGSLRGLGQTEDLGQMDYDQESTADEIATLIQAGAQATEGIIGATQGSPVYLYSGGTSYPGYGPAPSSSSSYGGSPSYPTSQAFPGRQANPGAAGGGAGSGAGASHPVKQASFLSEIPGWGWGLIIGLGALALFKVGEQLGGEHHR